MNIHREDTTEQSQTIPNDLSPPDSETINYSVYYYQDEDYCRSFFLHLLLWPWVVIGQDYIGWTFSDRWKFSGGADGAIEVVGKSPISKFKCTTSIHNRLSPKDFSKTKNPQNLSTESALDIIRFYPTTKTAFYFDSQDLTKLFLLPCDKTTRIEFLFMLKVFYN